MNQLWTILWSALGVILTGLVSWATAALVDFLNKKKEQNKWAKYGVDITQIVSKSVLCITQSFVDTMKKSGKWDEAAMIEAKERALTIIKKQLTPELIDYIKNHFGDVDVYLNTLVEAQVYTDKNFLY